MSTYSSSQNTILVAFQSKLSCVDFIFVLINIKINLLEFGYLLKFASLTLA